MRKDSTTLIRKYLDEIKRLETELALYRRRSKQLQEELREANDALQKDEEIFEEKMIEMKDINHEGRIFLNSHKVWNSNILAHELRDAAFFEEKDR